MDDDDFPFTFGNVSDGDEEEGLFVDKKAAKQRAALQSNAEPYQAQFETDGWLLQYLKAPAEAMYEKNGANKVKMLSEYLYLHGRYEEAFNIAAVYCQVVKDNSTSTASDRSFKVTDSRDLQEMMARTALKLGRQKEAAEIVDSMTSPDAGHVFLKATVYKAAGRYEEAVKCLVDFQQTRSSNYAIWRQMAECLAPQLDDQTLPISMSISSSTMEKNLRLALALISISRSRFLMEAASWPKSGFGQTRYIRELTRIKDLQTYLEKHAFEMEPSLKETDKGVYDRTVEAPIEAWRSLPSIEEQANILDTLDREVVDYIWETWVQTLKGDGSGAMPEHVDEQDASVKTVRSM